MNTKRLLLIIGFLIVLIALGALIYFLLLRDIVSPQNGNENTNVPVNNAVNGLPVINGTTNVNRITNAGNANLPGNFGGVQNVNTGPSEIAQGGETITKSAVSASTKAAEPSVSGVGVRYYDVGKGKFFQTDATGKAIPLSEQTFPDASSIAWAAKKNMAVITFPDSSKVLYDFDKQQQVTLPREWDNIRFSPAGDKIGFKNVANNVNDRWLAVAKPDGSEVQLIEPLGENGDDVAVNWSPTGQVVALYRDAQNGASQEVFPVGLAGENFKSIETDGRGFEGTWSRDGSQLLYSVYNAESQYNPSLYLVQAAGDQTGTNTVNLGLQTWSYKCTFGTEAGVIYCAVPRSLPVGTGIFPETAKNTNDTIYEMNMANNSRNVLALPTFTSGTRGYTVSSLFLSGNGQFLYFTDSNTGNVYSIQLK